MCLPAAAALIVPGAERMMMKLIVPTEYSTRSPTSGISSSRAATCQPSSESRAALGNYQDLWWNPAESGWGINLAHQGDTIVATWSTYGADGKPLNVKGVVANAVTQRLYVSTLQFVTCFDLLTDKIIWEKAYEGGCDRMSITPDGKVLKKTLTIPVQINDPEVARVSRLEFKAGESFTFDENVFSDMVAGSGKATMAVGPLARLRSKTT